MQVNCNLCDTVMIKIKDDLLECPLCHNMADIEEDGEIVFYHTNYGYSDVYDMPSICVTCDSDMYPDCREGCNMIDD